VSDIFSLIWDALTQATFGDFVFLYLILFFVFVVYMVKLHMPIIPSLMIGFILMALLANIYWPIFSTLLALLIVFVGILVALLLFKLGRRT